MSLVRDARKGVSLLPFSWCNPIFSIVSINDHRCVGFTYAPWYEFARYTRLKDICELVGGSYDNCKGFFFVYNY